MSQHLRHEATIGELRAALEELRQSKDRLERQAQPCGPLGEL